MACIFVFDGSCNDQMFEWWMHHYTTIQLWKLLQKKPIQYPKDDERYFSIFSFTFFTYNKIILIKFIWNTRNNILFYACVLILSWMNENIHSFNHFWYLNIVLNVPLAHKYLG